MNALLVFDDGSGAALYAGGFFNAPNGIQGWRVARWDGSSWGAAGGTMTDSILSLTAFDDGSGPALYAGAASTGGITDVVNPCARWDGSNWSPVAGGMNDDVWTLAVYDDGSGARLYAGGRFSSAGGDSASLVAQFDGSSWSALGGGGLDDDALALTVYDDGTGPALYAGGRFKSTGAVAASSIARWNGSSWSSLGSGTNGPTFLTFGVNALAGFDDGGGPALYAGGNFTIAGGAPANRIARWDGAGWSALGSGTNGIVRALAVYDDGVSPALYVAGEFTSAGGVTANRIARWDGASWSALGTGMNNHVFSLTVFDDGSGPKLYAGGQFLNAGGISAIRIAKWDGTTWSALSENLFGSNSIVFSLGVFDLGGGPALYAGGSFDKAGSVVTHNIAKWNGSHWSGLSGGTSSPVHSLAAFDDGSGPALYAGGDFLTAGGLAVNRIARWGGASWSALGAGITDRPSDSVGSIVKALAAIDHGCGPALYAGGQFESTLETHESFLVRWQSCADTTPPVLSCPPAVLVADERGSASGEIVTFHVTASDGCAPAAVICVPPSGSFFPRGTTTVVCTATDAAGNQATCSFPVAVALTPPVRVR